MANELVSFSDMLMMRHRTEGEVIHINVKDKPYRGRISNWSFMWGNETGRFVDPRTGSIEQEHLGFFVFGIYVDHKEGAKNRWATSYVVKTANLANGDIAVETLNSKYLLISNARTREEVKRMP